MSTKKPKKCVADGCKKNALEGILGCWEHRTGDRRIFEPILKRPKYSVGDVVVYPDRYGDKEDSMKTLKQSRIIEATGYIDIAAKGDTVGWFYETEETRDQALDNLEETDILYKL